MISITKNGVPLDISLYTYNEKTNTITTDVRGVVIDAGGGSTVDAGDSSTIDAGGGSTIKAGGSSTIDAGGGSTIKAGDGSTIKAGYCSTIKAGHCSTIKAGYCSTIKAGHCSTVDAGGSSTIKAGYCSVIVRKDLFEVIIFKGDRKIMICPVNVPGYVENGIYSVTGKPAIIADGILSAVVYKRKLTNCVVYKVVNHGETKESYLVEQNGLFSHGETIKDAKGSLIYKIVRRDTSAYNDFTLETEITLEEAIKMYRTISGACETGTRYFVEHHTGLPKKLSVQEMINLTEGQYNHEMLVNFLSKKEEKND